MCLRRFLIQKLKTVWRFHAQINAIHCKMLRWVNHYTKSSNCTKHRKNVQIQPNLNTEVLAHLVVAAVFKTAVLRVNLVAGRFDSDALPPFYPGFYRVFLILRLVVVGLAHLNILQWIALICA